MLRTPATKPVRDADDVPGDCTHGAQIEKCACVKADSAVATNTSTTTNSKILSAATSRPRVKDELPPQQASAFPQPSKHPTPRRSATRRAAQPQRKRPKICIKLGDCSSAPAAPGHPASSTSTHAAPAASPLVQRPAAGTMYTLASTHSRTQVAQTVSLTSLIHHPLTVNGREAATAGSARAHGIYVAPTSRPPAVAHRSAAQASAGAGGSAALARKPTAAFVPPENAEAVPEIVRIDRAVINTMHVGRRTSSRCAAPGPRNRVHFAAQAP